MTAKKAKDKTKLKTKIRRIQVKKNTADWLAQ